MHHQVREFALKLGVLRGAVERPHAPFEDLIEMLTHQRILRLVSTEQPGDFAIVDLRFTLKQGCQHQNCPAAALVQRPALRDRRIAFSRWLQIDRLVESAHRGRASRGELSRCQGTAALPLARSCLSLSRSVAGEVR